MTYTWQYYDLVLLGVFCSMVAGALVGQFTAVATTTAVTVAGLLAVVIIAHGLFVNGPVDAPEDLTDPVESLN
ncbi:hypothetical protein [Halomarina oriensis]|uniref:Uncharacterized protein n=1 Tax=Halomarina oriensis TaxID=671145 RepID=A0A6B0GRP5_9EURY|nr:hypothetical protein [Halomarina oriensis]MWG36329.1 hypothetical protein [Halomarina oriensis]